LIMDVLGQSTPKQGPKHRMPGLTWWLVSGRGYSSIVFAIFPPRRPVIGVWLLWAHDWRWRRVEQTPTWRKFHLGPVLVKISRRRAVERQRARMYGSN